MSTHTSTPTARALAAAIRANVPTLLWGVPGTGKTATINSWGESWGFHVESIVGSNREPSDFMGFPVEVDGQTVYSDLAWARRLAAADKGLLFLDELTTCSPSVQRVMLRILQERIVGELQLPDSVAMVAAANPPEIAVDGWDLAAPVANRLLHLDWVFDSSAWVEGFISDFAFTDAPSMEAMLNDGSESFKIRAKSMVMAFLKHRPDLTIVVPADPHQSGPGWPSPRSWTNVASVLSELRTDDEEATLLVLTGLVGEAAALEFVAWSLSSDLYDPEDVLADPSIVDWTSRPDRIFALVASLVAIAKMRGDATTWEKAVNAIVACATSGRPDLGYSGARMLLQDPPKGAQVPAEAISAFGNLFTKSGKWKANEAA
ncbi:MAG: AAA domain-containing protein [Acidobacteria bacterium]|nr:AAA domain-containing protein [Acidobacteriota bacterium]